MRRSSRARPARALLDVACGTGKHLERLAQDHSVEGMDLDAALLELALRRLPGVPLHQADMTSFELGRRFDAVVCLFSSIGYVKTRGTSAGRSGRWRGTWRRAASS